MKNSNRTHPLLVTPVTLYFECMKWICPLKLSIFSVGLLLVSSCGGAPEGKKKQVPVVNGDPIVFTRGTQMNGTTSGLPDEMFQAADIWNQNLSGYSQEVINASIETSNDQQPDESTSIDDLLWHQQSKVHFDSTDVIRMKSHGSQRSSEILLEKSNGLWRFKDIVFEGQSSRDLGIEYEIKHYSYLPDFSGFSILIYITSPGEKALINYYFLKQPTLFDEPSLLDVPYNYLFGRGNPVKWKKYEDIPVVICNIPYYGLRQALRDGMNWWKQPLRDRLDFSIEESDRCPPFSDLNVHGVYYVDDWIEVLGEGAVTGQTLPVAHDSNQEIIDSDMIYLKAEIREILQIVGADPSITSQSYFYYEEPVQALFENTSAHEFGHFLGLHHIFDGTPSVMSYDPDHDDQLHDYDNEAIQALYPLADDL